jgi:hypothetical protein
MRYEWRCYSCGEIIEIDRRLAEREIAPLLHEHDCGATAPVFERLVSAPSPLYPGAASWRGK